MLYFIGLGLGDAKDITVKGLETIKKCKFVYLEAYTSVLTVGKEELEAVYGREVRLADRTMVEQNADEILSSAKDDDVAFLVVGDPFGATTHTDLVIRAEELDIKHSTIHNASIMNAVGCCGLQLYSFGETISITFWTDTWKPESYFNKMMENNRRGLHTLCLLDIKMKEQSIENMMRGNQIYEPPRFMTVQNAAKQLLEISETRKAGGASPEEILSCESIGVGIARVGWPNQQIIVGTLPELAAFDLGQHLHSLVIPGKLFFLEVDMLKRYCISESTMDILSKIGT